MALRYLNAGESHGKLLLAVIEGMPAGVPLVAEQIDRELIRRQQGYGRGQRMKIERDTVEIVAGVRRGVTLGSPIGLQIRNKDWKNWEDIMSVEPNDVPASRVVTRPRPGHADLVGAIKYAHSDMRNVLEKASARETAIRVSVGAVTKALLSEFGIKIISHVKELGDVRSDTTDMDFEEIERKAEQSEVRCADSKAAEMMIKKIEEAKRKGDTLGGIFEIIATGIPVGLGSYSQWDRRLNARLSFSLMSIQAMKGIEIGMGFEASRRLGSEVHDEIFYDKKERSFGRKTNNAGGIEGGVSTGQPIIAKVAMKPISTLYSPLMSVDFITKEPFKASVERSDICAVPAASVIGESIMSFELATAIIEKFGGDSLIEMKRNYDGYLQYVRDL